MTWRAICGRRWGGADDSRVLSGEVLEVFQDPGYFGILANTLRGLEMRDSLCLAIDFQEQHSQVLMQYGGFRRSAQRGLEVSNGIGKAVGNPRESETKTKVSIG